MAHFKEVKTSTGRIIFRYATGGHSAGVILTGVATVALGLWARTWDGKTPRTNWIPLADKSYLTVPDVFVMAGIGLCLFALKLIWTYQHIELNEDGSVLTRVVRHPWKQSVQRFPFSDISRFVTTEEISRDEDHCETSSYRLVMMMKDESRVELGHGNEKEWKNLGDRLAQLTGAKSVGEKKSQ